MASHAKKDDRVIKDFRSPGQFETVKRFIEAGDAGERRIALERSLNAIVEIAERLDPEQLERIAAVSSDRGVLLELLSCWPADPTEELSWIYEAKLRGVEAKQRLLAEEGGAVTGEDLGKLLQISRQAVDKRRQANTLIAVEGRPNRWVYPVWQLEDGDTLFGLEVVLDALAEHDPWMTLQFFLLPSEGLDGRTPLDVLRSLPSRSDDERSGWMKRVTRAAKTYGTHGAD